LCPQKFSPRKKKGEIKAVGGEQVRAFFRAQTKHQSRLRCHKREVETGKITASLSFVHLPRHTKVLVRIKLCRICDLCTKTDPSTALKMKYLRKK